MIAHLPFAEQQDEGFAVAVTDSVKLRGRRPVTRRAATENKQKSAPSGARSVKTAGSSQTSFNGDFESRFQLIGPDPNLVPYDRASFCVDAPPCADRARQYGTLH